ncbi:hypothetical protein [Kitasatospora sp. NBC_01539]
MDMRSADSEREDTRRTPGLPGRRSCLLTRRLHIDLLRVCSARGPAA